MNWTPELRDFIQEHMNDDTAELLLAARKYLGIDVPFAVEQIEARRRLKGKLPEWYGNADLIMGGRVPAEQCSSEQTARYKRSIIEGQSLCDMTGGMGVDFWYMSEGMERAIYTERSEWLCEVAKHNFQMLQTLPSQQTLPSPSLQGGGSISANRGGNGETDEQGNHSLPVGRVRGGSAVRGGSVRCGDGRELPIPSVDVIYLDPARRAGDGSRVYAMEECEPNIVEWQDELLAHAQMVLVKLSPMVDLTDVMRKLKGVTEVHIVAVKNECKEVLVKQETLPSPFLQGGGNISANEETNGEIDEQGNHSLPAGRVRGVSAVGGVSAVIHCVDFLASSALHYTTKFPDEMDVLVSAGGVKHYLYEPDVTLMKAQAFGSLCHRFNVRQLEIGTHLMTSDEFIPDFPGRIFEVEEKIPFSSKVLKGLKKAISQANMATRNFVLTADELRKKTGIKDGGEVYLFGVKVKDVGQMLLKCRKKVVTSHP